MYFILLFAVGTFGLIFERARFFQKIKQPPAGFRQQILNHIVKGDYKGAETLALSQGETSLGRIVAVGVALRQQGSGDEEIQARMDEKLEAEIGLIDRRVGFLAMFGNVATLLGLLGTIVGMIHSFAAVASASPSDRAILLSKGISEAMNCTAFGLIVAIPALVAFAFFQNKTDRLVGEVTEGTTHVYHDLIFLTEGAQSQKARAQDNIEGRLKATLQPQMSQ
ncbi:MAG: MotA/TolQ/ExbB proton channel family protein [Oligoflexia bacterium]|nr:MotA/TolQ/ExbB proton channel family protein [Oligoflexia bacterium]